jgi:Mrp family chromosome partitioning ATPase
MGRMFRIITEGGAEGPRAIGLPDRGGAADVPFVEVGGPEGVVTSVPRPAARPPLPPPTVLPVPRPADPEPEPDEPLPVLPESEATPEQRVLSVAFHRFPQSGLRLMPTGVSPDVVVYHFPDHAVTGEYRTVREEVRRQFDEAGPRVVVLTAAVPVAGTTTVALNLAVALTQDPPAKVLVVDANFDRPAAARRLGVAETPGLAEVLGQTVPLAWAVQPTPVPNLHALAAGLPADGTDDAMASDFPRLLGQLRQWFDWVLVDGGVWDESLGRESVGPACDAVYLVTRQADVERPEFTALRASVTGAGGTLRGYVTTRQ